MPRITKKSQKVAWGGLFLTDDSFYVNRIMQFNYLEWIYGCVSFFISAEMYRKNMFLLGCFSGRYGIWWIQIIGVYFHIRPPQHADHNWLMLSNWFFIQYMVDLIIYFLFYLSYAVQRGYMSQLLSPRYLLLSSWAGDENLSITSMLVAGVL